MPVGIVQAIQVLRPDAETPRDFLVVDDGKRGQRIVAWNTGVLGAQPTAKELAAVTQDEVDAAREKRRAVETKAAIATLSLHPDPHFRALHLMTTTGLLSVVNDTRDKMSSKQPPVTAAAIEQVVTAALDAKIQGED